MVPKRPCVGVTLGSVTDMAQALTQIREAGFDYLCSSIVFDHILKKNLEYGVENITEPFSWSDLAISSNEWGAGVCGILSNLEKELDSDDYVLQKRAEDALKQQINYAQHLALPSVIVELFGSKSSQIARIILAKLIQPLNSIVFWVKIPMGAAPSQINGNGSTSPGTDIEHNGPSLSSWNNWHNLRTICNNEKRLFPVLELLADVPNENEVARWLGEPVKAIFLSPDIFTTNAKGFPVLSKPHQSILRKFFYSGAQIVIDSNKFTEDLKYYKQYIDYLHNNSREDQYDGSDALSNFSKGYEDYLQNPLQPLMDNLECQTYEVFEKDPVKYNLYETAIYEAIISRTEGVDKTSDTIVIMVVGAGRGPLVSASIRAAAKAEKKVKLYAIEKNANAVNTLLHLKSGLWKNDDVTVVHTDMREVAGLLVKADIMVSELLGSFSDNELSPECLEGAQSFLKDGGIMIPKNYSSYIAPIMSAKLHSEVRTHRDFDKPVYSHFETPYVVHMFNKYDIAEPEILFTFEHPKEILKETNDRHEVLNFKVQQDCVLHGFAGYFDSCLFGNVEMSTLPSKHSPGMFSWFPMLFPVKEPIFLRANDKLKMEFWRKSSDTNVWYEWCVTAPFPSGIHNSSGRSYNIGLR